MIKRHPSTAGYPVKLAGWIAVIVSVAWHATAAAPDDAAGTASPLAPPAPAIMERLRQGEILVDSHIGPRNSAGLTGMMLVRTAREEAWQALISCENAYLYIDGLLECEIIKRGEGYTQTHQVLDQGWITPRMDYVFQTEYAPFEAMRFHLVSGNLERLQGSWEFLAVSEGTLLRHRLEVRLSIPLPRWLVSRQLRRGFPGMLACIRKLAERGGEGRSSGAALPECPEAAQ